MDRFPRRYAATRRFTLGRPRAFRIADDGSRVAFLRSPAGDDPVQQLWRYDVDAAVERCVADPAELLGDREPADLPPEERARRERAREQAGGIVAYAADRSLHLAAFALGGRLYACDLTAGQTQALDVPGPVVDPRPAPDGRRIAWVAGGALHVVDADGQNPHVLAEGDGPEVTWGLAEFVAAEEIGRSRGFWWGPDSQRLVAARVDVADVGMWHVADPVDPSKPATVLRYPATGSANAVVTLAVIDPDGARTPLEWDADAHPYLVDVRWERDRPLTVVVQSRDQRRLAVLTADPDSGAVTVADELQRDPWIELVPGVPRWLDGHRLLTTVDDGDSRRLAVDGKPVSPPDLQVRRVIHADARTATVVASAEDPTRIGVWRVDLDAGHGELLTPDAGVADAAANGGTIVSQSAALDRPGVDTRVTRNRSAAALASHAERPGLHPRVELLTLGPRRLRAALLLPHGYDPAHGALPVLLDPYGGPHAQRVLQRADAYLVAQWFAEAGFAVLIADGRGTPGRGPAWEQAIAGDLATVPLEDQVGALQAAANQRPFLDLDRVAIRGWSFGGYLAALAVLRRPDVFQAAIAGAPVTNWRLYDTHYTERYLGQPAEQPDAYRRSSLLADAPRLSRPLLLIHGLSDDNVVAAHTLQLSRALLEAGCPHQVLPLSGVTHMTPQEVVAENLLRLQLAFLREALGLAEPSPSKRL